MRSFIALELALVIQQALADLQKELRTYVSGARWTNPQGTHLTLKFLGEVNQDQVAGITTELDQIAAQYQPFELFLRQMGAFPRLRAPRVLWVGVQAHDILKQLHQDVETRISPLGFPAEQRSFKAHLTLARLSGENWPLSWQEKFANSPLPISQLPWLIKEVVLFKSDLKPGGAIYSPVHISRFSGK